MIDFFIFWYIMRTYLISVSFMSYETAKAFLKGSVTKMGNNLADHCRIQRESRKYCNFDNDNTARNQTRKSKTPFKNQLGEVFMLKKNTPIVIRHYLPNEGKGETPVPLPDSLSAPAFLKQSKIALVTKTSSRFYRLLQKLEQAGIKIDTFEECVVSELKEHRRDRQAA